jgi:hypothetical protein
VVQCPHASAKLGIYPQNWGSLVFELSPSPWSQLEVAFWLVRWVLPKEFPATNQVKNKVTAIDSLQRKLWLWNLFLPMSLGLDTS